MDKQRVLHPTHGGGSHTKHHPHPGVHAKKGGVLGPIDGLTLGIIVGCSTAAILLIILIVVLVRLRKRRRKLFDLNLDDISDESINSTRSAPTSRSSSPRITKRRSYPDTTASANQGVLMRSVTVDTIPDFKLPPERVQPRGPGERARAMSVTSLQYQQSLIGSLQPEMYRHSSFSEDEESHLPPSQYGRLWFSLVFDAAVDQLHVTLIKVKNLPARDKSKTARDPFVKVFLLPDERTCHVSKVRKKTLSPIFNEHIIFQVTSDNVKSRILRFSVYDVDKRRVRHSLGHVMVTLKDIDLTKGETMWGDLEPMAQASASLGDLQFSLAYIPQTEKLKVVIIRGRNLRQLDYDQDSGLYVRVQVNHGRKLYKTKKSGVQQGCPDPEFNESFSFSISGKQLDSLSVVVSLMTTSTQARLGHDQEYGKVVVGPFVFARGEELLHWQEMLAQPRTAITRWHMLACAVSSE